MQLKKDVGSHFLAASNCLRKKWKIETDNRKYMNGLGGKVSKPSIFLTNYKKASKIPVSKRTKDVIESQSTSFSEIT